MQEAREELTRRIGTLKKQIEHDESEVQELNTAIAGHRNRIAKHQTLVTQYEQVVALLPEA